MASGQSTVEPKSFRTIQTGVTISCLRILHGDNGAVWVRVTKPVDWIGSQIHPTFLHSGCEASPGRGQDGGFQTHDTPKAANPSRLEAVLPEMK